MSSHEYGNPLAFVICKRAYIYCLKSIVPKLLGKNLQNAFPHFKGKVLSYMSQSKSTDFSVSCNSFVGLELRDVHLMILYTEELNGKHLKQAEFRHLKHLFAPDIKPTINICFLNVKLVYMRNLL